MVLKSTSANNISVYQVSGTNISRSLPDWVAKKRKRALKQDLEYQNRIELIQDFEFSEASNKIKVSADGQYAMATGTYKPQIHVYDFSNLSLKFERHTDSENVDFVILSDDWTKSVHLQNDRSIEFHTKGGLHYKSRIPRFGRSLAYNANNCDLLVAAAGNELYRLNLDKGRYLNPFILESNSGANYVDVNPIHGLTSVGLEEGTVEFWDPRSRHRAAKLFVSEQLSEDCEVTVSTFAKDGLRFACGTSSGKALVYDLRNATPLIVKDQGYGYGIKKISWLENNISDPNNIMTSDKRIAKIWNAETGKAFASMEPSVDINDVEYLPGTGMFFMANEGIQMHTYYIPNLGPAPTWCSFLDNVTEELEERPSDSVYSNYRFITRDDVSKLNLSHLIGSNVLRSYMHGFFIDNELYDKVNLIANPNTFRDQREREIRNRIEKERESRIRSSKAVTHTKVKVNKDLASKLQERQGNAAAEVVINDDRFKELFENPDFAVDEASHEYKQLNPVQSSKDVTDSKKRSLTAAEESDEERINNINAGSDDSSSDSEDSENEESKSTTPNESTRGRIREEMIKLNKKKEDNNQVNRFMNQITAVSQEVGLDSNESLGSKLSTEIEKKRQHDQKYDNTRLHRHARGEAELTFVPKGKSKGKKSSQETTTSHSIDKGRTKQRYDGRRKASKNVFRGM